MHVSPLPENVFGGHGNAGFVLFSYFILACVVWRHTPFLIDFLVANARLYTRLLSSAGNEKYRASFESVSSHSNNGLLKFS